MWFCRPAMSRHGGKPLLGGFQRLFGPGGHLRKDFGLTDSQVGQDLAVDVDVRLLQTVYELVVAQAVLAGAGVDAL